LNSLSKHHEKLTTEFIPGSDIILFLTSSQQVLNHNVLSVSSKWALDKDKYINSGFGELKEYIKDNYTSEDKYNIKILNAMNNEEMIINKYNDICTTLSI
jgi:hypothetical protein